MSEKANPFAKFLSHHSKGDYIFREGDEGDEMYIIQTGRVSIQKVIRGKKTPLTVLEKGDFFGEMSASKDFPEPQTPRRSKTRTSFPSIARPSEK